MPITTTVKLDLDGSGAFATTISPYLLEATIRQGRTKSLDPMEPAVATVKLNNADGRFSPDNAAGDYYPDFDDNGVGIRIEAGTRRFTGVITEIRQDPFIENQEVVLTCTDRLGLLAGQTVSCGLFRQQPLHLVLNRVLDCLEKGEEITNPGGEDRDGDGAGDYTNWGVTGGAVRSIVNTISFEGDWCIQAACDGSLTAQGLIYNLGAAVTSPKAISILARCAPGDGNVTLTLKGLDAGLGLVWARDVPVVDDAWTYYRSEADDQTGHKYIVLCTQSAVALTILADCLHQVPLANKIGRSIPTTLDAEVELFGLYEAPALENLNRLLATEAAGFLYMRGFESGYGTIYASAQVIRDGPSAWGATFGKTAIGAGTYNAAQDTKLACKYNCPTSRTIDAILWYGQRVTVAIKAKAMIYADSAGSPGALLATSQEITDITTTPAWHSFPFATPVTLTATDYWLGIIVDDGTAVYYRDAAAADQTWINADTYEDGPSDPFGAGTLKPDYDVSIVAVSVAAIFGDNATNVPYVGLKYGLDAKERVSRAEVRSQGTYEATNEEATIWALSPIGQIVPAAETKVFYAQYSQPSRGCVLSVNPSGSGDAYYQGTEDGYIQKYEEDHPPDLNVIVETGAADLYIGQKQYLPGWFAVYRSYVRFDTSGIAAGETVVEAKLRAKLHFNATGTTDEFGVQVRDKAWGATLAAGDWDGTGTLRATYETEDLPPGNEWVEIALPIAAVQKEAWTQFELMSDNEAVEPDAGEHISFWSGDSADPPQLIVTLLGSVPASESFENYGVGARIEIEAGATKDLVIDVMTITGYPFQACSEESVVVADAITPPVMPATLSVEMPLQGTRTPDMVAEAARLALRHSGKVRRLPLSLQEQDAASLAQMQTRELDDLVTVINEAFAFSTKLNVQCFVEGMGWTVSGQGKVLEIVYNLEEK